MVKHPGRMESQGEHFPEESSKQETKGPGVWRRSSNDSKEEEKKP